jgi:hypothetical protein
VQEVSAFAFRIGRLWKLREKKFYFEIKARA